MERKEFVKEVLRQSVLGYELIDLEPSSQTNISVVIGGNGKAYVSAISVGVLTEMSFEDLINNYCGMLLVNNISCIGYTESSFLHNRDYDIDSIMNDNKSIEDFEEIATLVIMKFTQLLKALCTNAYKDKTDYYVNLYYAENYLMYTTKDNYKNGYDNEMYIEYDIDTKYKDLIETTINKILK